MLRWEGGAVCYCSLVSPVLTNKALSAPTFPVGSQRRQSSAPHWVAVKALHSVSVY